MTDRQPMTAVMAAIVGAETIPGVWDTFADALAGLGFDNILYGANRFSEKGILGDRRDALILHRGPRDYADQYLGEELYLHSPTYDWAEHNRGFVSWPEAIRQFRGTPTPQVMRIAQLNAQFGFTAGFVGSLSGVMPGTTGVIGFSPAGGVAQAQADALWREVGREVESLCALMHLRVATLPHTGLRRPLTTRQRETLEWYSRGKTAQDIGTIMGLSIATVEKHLRMARDSLDAQTTAHAVRKAAALNLLTA
ncbi:MAG: LuxR family transcriptional regulator [Pseudooceanicola sp.]|nr:LuxR family transcriptional regulator [Pseudooceanicola sp.]